MKGCGIVWGNTCVQWARYQTFFVLFQKPLGNSLLPTTAIGCMFPAGGTRLISVGYFHFAAGVQFYIEHKTTLAGFKYCSQTREHILHCGNYSIWVGLYDFGFWTAGYIAVTEQQTSPNPCVALALIPIDWGLSQPLDDYWTITSSNRICTCH